MIVMFLLVQTSKNWVIMMSAAVYPWDSSSKMCTAGTPSNFSEYYCPQVVPSSLEHGRSHIVLLLPQQSVFAKEFMKYSPNTQFSNELRPRKYSEPPVNNLTWPQTQSVARGASKGVLVSSVPAKSVRHHCLHWFNHLDSLGVPVAVNSYGSTLIWRIILGPCPRYSLSNAPALFLCAPSLRL